MVVRSCFLPDAIRHLIRANSVPIRGQNLNRSGRNRKFATVPTLKINHLRAANLGHRPKLTSTPRKPSKGSNTTTPCGTGTLFRRGIWKLSFVPIRGHLFDARAPVSGGLRFYSIVQAGTSKYNQIQASTTNSDLFGPLEPGSRFGFLQKDTQ